MGARNNSAKGAKLKVSNKRAKAANKYDKHKNAGLLCPGVFFMVVNGSSCLPEVYAKAVWQIHFIAGLYAECVIEFGDVWKRSVDAVLGRGVHICMQLVGNPLRTLFHKPAE